MNDDDQLPFMTRQFKIWCFFVFLFCSVFAIVMGYGHEVELIMFVVMFCWTMLQVDLMSLRIKAMWREVFKQTDMDQRTPLSHDKNTAAKLYCDFGFIAAMALASLLGWQHEVEIIMFIVVIVWIKLQDKLINSQILWLHKFVYKKGSCSADEASND